MTDPECANDGHRPVIPFADQDGMRRSRCLCTRVEYAYTHQGHAFAIPPRRSLADMDDLEVRYAAFFPEHARMSERERLLVGRALGFEDTLIP